MAGILGTDLTKDLEPYKNNTTPESQAAATQESKQKLDAVNNQVAQQQAQQVAQQQAQQQAQVSQNKKPSDEDLQVVKDVLSGKYGNNQTTPTRAEQLKAKGYDPDYIQSIINHVTKDEDAFWKGQTDWSGFTGTKTTTPQPQANTENDDGWNKMSWVDQYLADPERYAADRAKERQEKFVEDQGEIKTYDPEKSSQTITIDNPHTPEGSAKIVELEKQAPNGYYEEVDGKGVYHLNDKNTEKRAEEAQEDLAKGRANQDAVAPSVNEQYNEKAQEGDLNAFADEYIDWKTGEKKPVYTKEELEKKAEYYRDPEHSDPSIVAAAEQERGKRADSIVPKKEEETKEEESVVPQETTEDTETSANESNAELAEDAALAQKEEQLQKYLEQADDRIADLADTYTKQLKDVEDELGRHEDAARLSEFLPKLALSHYFKGDFGEVGSTDAKRTLGYFLLDKLGTALVNAGSILAGGSATATTAIENYNKTMMENALKRDDSNRAKIMEEKVNEVIKNSDALRRAGFDTNITFANDIASKFLQQYADQVDEKTAIKIKKEMGDWYDKLSDVDKMAMDRAILAMSANPSDRQKAILKYQMLGYLANAETDAATAATAKYMQAEAAAKMNAVDQLTAYQVKQAEVAIDNMVKQGQLTEAQIADAWNAVVKGQKEIDYYKTDKIMSYITNVLGAISTGVGIATGAGLAGKSFAKGKNEGYLNALDEMDEAARQKYPGDDVYSQLKRIFGED